MTFDLAEYHRRRIRELEARTETLEQLLAHSVRLLAASLSDRFAGTDVDPLAYLQACADVDMSLYALKLAGGPPDAVVSPS